MDKNILNRHIEEIKKLLELDLSHVLHITSVVNYVRNEYELFSILSNEDKLTIYTKGNTAITTILAKQQEKGPKDDEVSFTTKTRDIFLIELITVLNTYAASPEAEGDRTMKMTF
jgi:hypothetical protein